MVKMACDRDDVAFMFVCPTILGAKKEVNEERTAASTAMSPPHLPPVPEECDMAWALALENLRAILPRTRMGGGRDVVGQAAYAAAELNRRRPVSGGKGTLNPQPLSPVLVALCHDLVHVVSTLDNKGREVLDVHLNEM